MTILFVLINSLFQGGENQMKKVTLGDIVHPSIEWVFFLFSQFYVKS